MTAFKIRAAKVFGYLLLIPWMVITVMVTLVMYVDFRGFPVFVFACAGMVLLGLWLSLRYHRWLGRWAVDLWFDSRTFAITTIGGTLAKKQHRYRIEEIRLISSLRRGVYIFAIDSRHQYLVQGRNGLSSVVSVDFEKGRVNTGIFTSAKIEHSRRRINAQLALNRKRLQQIEREERAAGKTGGSDGKREA